MLQINAALLSFGMSGQVFHAPFIDLHPGFKLMGSWERSTKKIGEVYSRIKSYGSLEAVINDEEVDIVIVNTPTYTHFDYAKKALEAGKHIVVEKAFTATAKEAKYLSELAQSKGLKLSVFQNRRWDSDFKTVKSVVEQELIGDVVEATITFARYNPDLSPKTHKEKPSSGAGIIKDLGSHVIDQALYLFGMPEYIFGDIAITRQASEVDDYFDILLTYADKRVHVRGGYFFREPTPSYIFHGKRGSFLKSRSDVQEDQLKAGMKPNDPNYGIEPVEEQGLLHTELEGQIVRKKIKTLPGDYKMFYEGVYQSITKNLPEPVTAGDGINCMKVIDAAFQSSREKRMIALD